MRTFRPADRIWQIASPSAPVVSLADMRDHCRVDGGASDAVLIAYSAAAVAAVEARTQRLLTPRTAILRLRDLPPGATPIELPGGPVSSVTSVVAAGVELSGFEVIGDSPALLVPDEDWPVLSSSNGYPVSIVYVVGHECAPPDLEAAVKLIAAEMYERRETGDEKTISQVPVSAEYLMAPHRIWPAST